MSDIIELEKAVAVIDAEIVKLRDKKRAAARALEAAVEQENAARKLGNMSDSEKAALVQILKAEGIGSAEAVNGQ